MSTPVHAQGPQPADRLMQLLTGYTVSIAIYSVTKLGIPDLLSDGAKSVRELAKATGTNEDALYRVMRLLASVGILAEGPPQTFALAPAGEYLRSDRADSLRDMAVWVANPFHFQLYSEMPHCLETGEPIVEKVFGIPCFDYFAKDKEMSAVFNTAMTGFSKVVAPAVLDAYDFSWLNGKTLVDVGGGHGYLLTEILKKYPDLRGIVFDLEHVLAGTKTSIEGLGLAGRCGTGGGDFFQAVPAGDAYIMKNIIHDWDDERALKILKSCHRAGKGPARVILLEAILLPENEPNMAKWLDIEMLLLPGGRERTEEEFRRLFEQAGFRLTRVLQTKSPLCVIEAEKRA